MSGGRLALGVAALLAATAARGDFVRAVLKIDVRDGAGRPKTATVQVEGPGGKVAVERAGEVWVTRGLVEGDYRVTVEGATQAVHVQGRSPHGVVFVVGPRRPPSFALGAHDHPCDGGEVVVEAVAFGRHGGLGAGRLDVNKKGKAVCSAVIAGGAATLHLDPGEYEVTARFAGGGSDRARYRVRAGHTPPPLALRAR